jgi:peptidoglycan/xylan/chitin deacetylase (PgdA/CDA1 family)
MVAGPPLSLLYHACGDRQLPHADRLFPVKSAEAFERDLAYLSEHFTPVGHDQVVAHYEGRCALPSNAVEVSFDDGLRECHSVARPLLLRYGIPATFFCITNSIDNAAMMFRNKISLCLNRLEELSAAAQLQLLGWISSEFGVDAHNPTDARSWMNGLQHDDSDRIDALCGHLGIDIAAILRAGRPYLTREEIRELARDGFTLGAHSCNHPRLERLPWEEARREVLESCSAMRHITGARVVPFAIPFGGLGLPRDSLASLLGPGQGISLVYDTNDLMRDRPFVINRIQVDGSLGSWGGRSNLGFLIRRARILEPLRSVKRRLRRAGRS